MLRAGFQRDSFNTSMLATWSIMELCNRGRSYVVMCTNTGLLLKFTDNIITKRYSIKCCNTESITPFTTYNPLHKYFIIKAADLLLIISEQTQFKVVQEYQQVKDFSVGDFTGCGSPTVRIFTQNSDTPQILTDLIKKSAEPPIVGDMVSNILRDKFQVSMIFINL
ncbi:unnamed protein product, partial [Timema podura]|nr:unnamed protein product [Timema podura]